MRESLPVTLASGSEPIFSRAGRLIESLPTSISSTVPRKIRSPMSAIVAMSVPAWYDVSGTTGSPGLTIRSSTTPASVARMTDSIAAPRPSMRPRRVSSRLSLACASSVFVRSLASRAASRSPRETTPALARSAIRLKSAAARSKATCAWRRRPSASISSPGVGSGWISNSGSPVRTTSPTWTKHCLTIPEIFDLTWNFSRGSIWPVARAFSVTDPRATSTIFMPSVPDFRPWKKA